MAKPGKTGLRRIINAVGYSWLGFKAAFTHEAAFRQELFLVLIMSPIAIIYTDSGIEIALLMGSLFLVLIVELVNSALEAVVDRISDENHELSGRAKDIGSTAVAFALVNVMVIWSVILVPKF